ncbi:MAG: cytochrome P450 [Rubrivivax sp.]|nr:MAG: cytochrome P450 [Rubrivivax sp.]
MNLTRWAGDVPRVRGWSHDARLLANPYRYLSSLMLSRDTDALQLRLMGEPTLCLAGGEAVAFFYDAQQIRRRDAAPEPLRATLFGKGGVQGLDDAAHRHRKAMFLRILGPGAVAMLCARVRQEWLAALQRWQHCEEINLYRALQAVLTAAVCEWAGLPLGEGERALRTQQLVALFDDAARGLRGHLNSRLRRRDAEAWACGLIDEVRRGARHPLEHTALAVIARHREEDGALLPPRVAAVELLNVLRPVVAVSLYLVFVAHALDAHADWAERLRGDVAGKDALHFVQEVRRHYPFFPMLVGRARDGAWWRSGPVPEGMRVVLDLYGTNHSRRDWVEPDIFLPQRWRSFPLQPPLAFVPQGGGPLGTGHRCPGEDVAVQLMLLALDMFLLRMRWELQPPRPALDFTRLPALPVGGLCIRRPAALTPFNASAPMGL